jgi:hypothetical protein
MARVREGDPRLGARRRNSGDRRPQTRDEQEAGQLTGRPPRSSGHTTMAPITCFDISAGAVHGSGGSRPRIDQDVGVECRRREELRRRRCCDRHLPWAPRAGS